MRIDREKGTVALPNGLEIDPALTQDEFRDLPIFEHVQRQDYGTLPWIHYHFPGGQINGKDLLVNLCFYDQMLVGVGLAADLYVPGPKDWSRYSLDVEAETKQFHDRLLKRMFGKPSKGEGFLRGRLPDGQQTLRRPLEWQFPWGCVGSSHDFKGGGTSITVSYRGRLEEANKGYARRSVKRPL